VSAPTEQTQRREVPTLVSVIVPMLNAEPWIAEQLEALAEQTFGGAWEAVIVDNGSTDRSVEIASAFAGRLPDLRIVAAHQRRSLNHARNVGASAARGDFLVFCDADDVVTPTWLAALVTAAPRADLVGGTFDIESLNPRIYQDWRPDEPLTELPLEHNFMPYVCGGNCGIWSDVARELQWDERFDHGSSETEFCWRAQLSSYTLAFVPEAVIKLRYRRTLGQLISQYYSYGRSGALLYRCFRGHGMQRDFRTALWWWRWIVRRSGYLFESRARRGNWLRVLAFRCGRLSGSVAAGVFFP
jgi:glycosyltransferase involved in cell wall biosynthesis